MRGRFITLEGIDGAGKTTHLEWLSTWLRERGTRVTVTREPGGTALGERLRALLLDREQRMHPETETLLMCAARREHLDKVILPALESGQWVLCDRFTDATYAYQGGGSGVPWAQIAILERWVQSDLEPDVTLLFDVPYAVGHARSRAARPPDRYEQENEAFHNRVRDAYLRRAREHPLRIRVIDAGVDVLDIHKELEQIMVTI